MNAKTKTKIIFITCIGFLFFDSINALCQSKSEQYLNDLSTYLEIEFKSPEKDSLVNYMQVARDTMLTTSERAPALVNFWVTINGKMGYEGFYSESFLSRYVHRFLNRISTSLFSFFSQPDSLFKRMDSPLTYLKKGNSEEAIIMIPPIGYPAEVFDILADSLSSDYSVYAITPPGMGGTKSYPWPEVRDFSKQPWFTHLENEIQRLIKEERLKNVSFLGMLESTYLAFRLAEMNPDITASIVGINGILHDFQHSPDDPEQAMDLEERIEYVNGHFPKEVARLLAMRPSEYKFYDPAINQTQSEFYKLFSSNSKISRSTTDYLNIYQRYLLEFASADIIKRERLRIMDIPILNLYTIYDEQSSTNEETILAQWQKLSVAHPGLDVYSKPIKYARDFPYLDKPDEVVAAIRAFLEQPESVTSVQSNPQEMPKVARKSYQASETQVLGTTKIRIEYSRPNLFGRAIFGELVPWDELWRAGANEATRFETDGDILIQGNLLPAGNYSLFMIPREEEEWTLIFNKVHTQWGAFQYDSNFDQFRIEVSPQEVTRSEFLSYDLQLNSHHQAELEFRWDDTMLAVPIEEAYQIPSPPEKVKRFAWKKVLEDEEGDGRSAILSDGKSLSYYYDSDTDSLWFKAFLHNEMNRNALAINIVIDSDADQETGINWYGANTSFTFDKIITLWLRRVGDKYDGVNGIADAQPFRRGQRTSLSSGSVNYYLDPGENAYIIGVKRSDIDASSREFNVLGAVGEYRTWNDDISDSEYANIKLQ